MGSKEPLFFFFFFKVRQNLCSSNIVCKADLRRSAFPPLSSPGNRWAISTLGLEREGNLPKISRWNLPGCVGPESLPEAQLRAPWALLWAQVCLWRYRIPASPGVLSPRSPWVRQLRVSPTLRASHLQAPAGLCGSAWEVPALGWAVQPPPIPRNEVRAGFLPQSLPSKQRWLHEMLSCLFREAALADCTWYANHAAA